MKHTPCPLKAFKDNKGKWGFKNPLNGVVAIAPIYDSAFDISEGLAAVEQNEEWGYIDGTGDVAIPFIYNYAENFYDGHATVYESDGDGNQTRKEIDIDGTLHLEIHKVKGLFGFTDIEENVIIPAIYDEVLPFSEGLATVRKGNKWGYINKNGEIVVPIIYKGAKSFAEGLAVVSSFGEYGYGYINKEGEVVIPFGFDNADQFSDGIAIVYYDRTCYYGAEQCCINKNGEFVEIAYCVEHIHSSFSNGRAAVRIKNLFGYIDTKGQLVIQPEYEDYGEFKNGCAIVMKDKKIGCIDTNGNVMVPFIFEDPQEMYSEPKFLIEKYLSTKDNIKE